MCRRRLAEHLTRLGVWKVVERRSSPYRLRNYGYFYVMTFLKGNYKFDLDFKILKQTFTLRIFIYQIYQPFNSVFLSQ
jgi:hypothetical protein